MTSRPLRALYAWFGYSSAHFAAGRPRRGLFWIALMLAAIVFIMHLPIWIVFAIGVAQVVDAAIIEPVRDRSHGAYAVFGLVAVCISVLVAVTLRTTWVEAFKIPSGSSIPTLLVGDHIFVDKTAKHPHRGDTTVFIYPKERDFDFIKRVVAVGGDTIEIRDNQLVLNGQPVPRKHVDEPCEYDDYVEDTAHWERHRCEAWDEMLDGRTYRVVFELGSVHSTQPVTVPPDSYFVLGDNRDNSHDSRFWGFVPQALIKGVARKIWWSAGSDGVRWRRIDQPVF
ncbi:MAG TPA: signal peptidase I [Polyangia bacterium]|jgi:signal peptidase I|nr:signal peptidase I [Polyangia bacterium]